MGALERFYRHREWHHNGKKGIYTDMRSYRKNNLTNPQDIDVDRRSDSQIWGDVQKGIHKLNVNFYGVVRNEDTPDFNTVNSADLKLVPNCKNELYFNCLVYCGIGENKLKNVDWYI